MPIQGQMEAKRCHSSQLMPEGTELVHIKPSQMRMHPPV